MLSNEKTGIILSKLVNMLVLFLPLIDKKTMAVITGKIDAIKKGKIKDHELNSVFLI